MIRLVEDTEDEEDNGDVGKPRSSDEVSRSKETGNTDEVSTVDEEMAIEDYVSFRISKGHTVKKVRILLNNKEVDAFFDTGSDTDIAPGETTEKLKVGTQSCKVKVNVLEGQVEINRRSRPMLLELGVGRNKVSCYVTPLVGLIAGSGLLIGTGTMKKLGITILMHEGRILWNTYTAED
eukprot:Nk52_evm1s1386 gene=Nk52_evmTU1s1386